MIVWCHVHAGHLKPKFKYCKDESRKSRAKFFLCEIHSCFHEQSDNITLWHQLEIKCLLRLVLVMILIATDMVIKECKL